MLYAPNCNLCIVRPWCSTKTSGPENHHVKGHYGFCTDSACPKHQDMPIGSPQLAGHRFPTIEGLYELSLKTRLLLVWAYRACTLMQSDDLGVSG